MGRLFWKFFFAFWLAVLIAGLTVGATFWLRQQSEDLQQNRIIDTHATAFIIVAVDIQRQAGDQALIQFLSRIHDTPGPDIYAVDANGQDLLGRTINAEAVAAARMMLEKYPELGPVKQITLNNGKPYLLFAPQHHPEHALNQVPKVIDMFSSERPELSETISHLPPEFAPHPPGPPPPPIKRIPLFWLIGIGAITSILFSWLLAWYFTRPIKQLREAFSKVAEGQLETRVGKNMHQSHDELTDLGDSFDEMASQVQNLVISQQRLLHDVSHELRSPLARMQAAIGIAQQQPDKVENILQRLEKDSQRISDLVGELLLLSKLETGVSNHSFAKLNLTELISDIVDDVSFEAATRDIKVRFNPQQQIHVNGQPTLLQRAIENIIRNAVEYSDSDTSISVEMEKDTAQKLLQIHIKDAGPGVPEHELETIFKPFYRSGNKRVNDSVGLGLTIAHRAIQSHGGSIEAYNLNGGGLCVTISLPLTLVID